MAFSTKVKGHPHLQGNVQVYNVRIPAGTRRELPRIREDGLIQRLLYANSQDKEPTEENSANVLKGQPRGGFREPRVGLVEAKKSRKLSTRRWVLVKFGTPLGGGFSLGFPLIFFKGAVLLRQTQLDQVGLLGIRILVRRLWSTAGAAPCSTGTTCPSRSGRGAFCFWGGVAGQK